VHILTTWALGPQPRIEIDETRFNDLRRAMRVHVAIMQIEEKFDLVIANYEEFERDILSVSLRDMVRRDLPWHRMSADRLLLNRRITNLLSTCRLYVDQVKHDLRDPSLAVAEPEQGDAAFRVEHDRSLGYRVMEALRNYLQHQGIPITGISYPSHLEEDERGPLFQFRLSLKLDLDALRSSDFKRSVMKELDALPEVQADPVLFVRQYVEGLGRVHAEVREIVTPRAIEVDAIVVAAIDEWIAAGNSPIGFVAAALDERGVATDHVNLTLNLKERRDELAQSNQILNNLSRRYVSSVRDRSAYPLHEFHGA
jgi:hypothetical protein